MSIYLYIISASLIFLAGAGAGVKWEVGIVASRDLAIQQEGAEELKKQEHRVDNAAASFEADKNSLRLKFTPIQKEINRVTQTDFYAAGQPACFDDDGLRQLHAAIATLPASASQPAGAVPRPRGTHWWESAGDPPLVH